MHCNKRVILFGGSFDPIHTGHLRVAQHAMAELNATELIFVPTRRSPHKTDHPASGTHRLAMIKIAIEGVAGFSVSDCELKRPDPSYSLDTILFFRDQFGAEAELFWLVGADQLPALQHWYRINELLDNCRISVMVRAGYPDPDFESFDGVFSPRHIEQLRQSAVETPQIDLSSTEIRAQCAAGGVSGGALHEGVWNYIRRHCLYGFSR